MTKRTLKPETRLAHLGNDPQANHGIINPPVYHASTILFDQMEVFEARHGGPERRTSYGRSGTPTFFALESAVAELEGGAGTVVASSGLAAVTSALLAFVEAGDHVLITDACYEPTRRFCERVLTRLGVDVEFYDPMIGGDISELLRPNSRLVYMESPGSLTFETQDVPAIVEAAKAAGAMAMLDNTWATPLYFKPLDFGVDVSIQAGTKYFGGHSDVMMGLITTTADRHIPLRRNVQSLGQCAGPDDIYLTLRGLRTLAVRLARHQETGLTLAHWLSGRPEVAKVLHPALPGTPGHEIWRRDFTGASGLFSLVLARDYPRTAVAAMIEGLELFGIGASWGGYESLIMPAYPERVRTAAPWQAPGPTLRIHAGLEHPDDLIDDLNAGFERLERATESAQDQEEPRP
jgi:cystathionine beta-lyase